MAATVSYPLSPRQRRLVRLADGGPRPALWAVVRLHAEDGGSQSIDEAALARSVAATAERHEILRTRLVAAPGLSLPLQGVEPVADPILETVDVPGEALRDDALARRAAGEAARRAGDDVGPAAIRVRGAGGEGGALLLVAPALHNDPAGMLRWAEEIAHGYAAALPESAAPPLPPVELQLAQIGEWQAALLEDPDEESARAFWRDHDPGVLAELPVPLAGAAERPPRQELGGVHESVRRALPFGRDLAAQALAARGTSTEVLLLTAWRVTVARLTGDPAGRVGVWAAGRELDVLAGSLGPVGRYLPLADADGLAGGDRFEDAVAATAVALERAVEAQEQFAPPDLPEAPGEPVRPDRFAVAFRHLDLGSGWRAGGVTFTPVALGGTLEPVGVELAIEAGPEAFAAELRFDPRWLDAGAAGRLLDAFTLLAAAALARPRSHLSDLPLHDAAGMRAELEAGRGVALPAPAVDRAATFPARFAALAARHPGALAILDGDRAVTFGALEARSRRLAARLVAAGVGPEVPVALVGHRDAATLVGLVAILRAGGVLLPLDPSHPEARVSGVLEEALPAAVLRSEDAPEGTDEPLRRAAAAAGVPWLTTDTEDDDGAAQLPEVDPEQSAYLLFTSGSTGRPKGTRVCHCSLAHLEDSLEAGVLGLIEASLGAPVERVALNAPLVFDASVKQWMQLARGRCLVTVPEAVRLDARRFVAELAGRRVDLVDATPSHLGVLLDAGLAAARHPRAVLVGGEAVVPELWQRMVADAGRCYVNVYGPTECTVDASAAVVSAGFPHLGAPLPGACLHVVDEVGRPVPRGAPGELHVGGPGVARGYLGRPGETAARFVPDPFPDEAPGSRGGRLFATGDLARRRPDGSLVFLGRRDRQVKLRGLRIELEEIETVLASHPAVRQAAVTTDGETLLAWAAVGDGADTEPARLRDALRKHLRHRLPEFMVPAHLGLLRELPRTRRGKADLTALVALGVPREAARGPRLAPRNATESRLAEIWGRVLGIQEVGVEDNFFDLGGHSLLMVRVYDEVQQSFGTELPMLELFRHPTVAALAARLEGGGGEGTGVDAGRVQERARRQAAAAAAARRRRHANRGEEAR